MGVNNKQRRAAKRKKKASTHRPPGPGPGAPFVAQPTPELARAELFHILNIVEADGTAAEVIAQQLQRPDALLPPDLMTETLCALLAEMTTRAVGSGWGPADIAHIVRRKLGDAHVPAALALLSDEAARHPTSRVARAWLDELADAGMAVPVDVRRTASLAAALRLAALLVVLPPIAVLLPRPGAATRGPEGGSPSDGRLLAKVRALLAKAESTEYDEEAEALSAKAQELISRHSLERLLAESDGASATDAAVARRIWIDPPYVFAKAVLVGAVAEANHCKSVTTQDLGFCTVVGRPEDLAAVDVLVTSLLVQASTAMRRHGRQLDRSGTSRTRSFRQSFLVAYAGRIRERLLAAAEEAVRGTGRGAELVLVLHRQAEEVDAATHAIFPKLVTREAAISNAQGWVAGRAAADFARLDAGKQIAEAG